MNVLKKTLILAGCIAALGFGTDAAMAQGGGGGGGAGGGFGGGGGGGGGRRGRMTPQEQLDTYRTDMEVKDDAEWTAISAKITAVQTAQRANFGGFGGRGGGRAGRGGGGAGGGGGGGFTPPETPLTDAVAALQKAYDDKAPAAEIKDKMAKVRDLRKTNQAAFTKAQEDLRAVLSARQEAYLTLNSGLLN